MKQKRSKFIVRNEPFQCLHCGFANEPLKASCRNHCRKCLYSRHVDLEVPGDRKNPCRGMMKPVTIDDHSKKGKMLIHECLTCGEKMRNMVARDDDLEAIIKVINEA